MTIECDLQYADWIAEKVPGEKRSANDKAVLNLAAEVRRLSNELVFAKPLFSRRLLLARLARAGALPAKWRSDLAKFKSAPCPTWQIDPTALIERATAAFCEELEAALGGDE